MSVVKDEVTDAMEPQSVMGQKKPTVRFTIKDVRQLGRPRRIGSAGVTVEQVQKRIKAEFGLHSDSAEVLAGLSFRFVLGLMISYRRRALGLSQLDLATLYGSSRELISQIESGRTEVNSGDLPRLAEILDVPITSLFGLAEGEVERANELRRSEAKGTVMLHPTPVSLTKEGGVMLLLEKMAKRVSHDLAPDEQLVLDTIRSCDAETRASLTRMVSVMAYALKG